MVARACLVLMAGGAGAGKTVLAREVVRRVANAVLLDKDRLLGPWVDRVLRDAGAEVDRDGDYYWRSVRPQEYATLEAMAYDHLELGKVVVVDAPLRPELEDPAWVARVRDQCAARGASLVAAWVVVSPETARQRMYARGEARDRWKLANWEEFLKRQPYDPPAGASLVLANDDRDSTEKLIAAILQTIQAAEPAPPRGQGILATKRHKGHKG
jgi:predicted kinase